jgi:NADH dehydrogenase FAD-containing subunit
LVTSFVALRILQGRIELDKERSICLILAFDSYIKTLRDVYAMGDCAEIEGNPLMATAQVAVQQARYLATSFCLFLQFNFAFFYIMKLTHQMAFSHIHTFSLFAFYIVFNTLARNPDAQIPPFRFKFLMAMVYTGGYKSAMVT